MNEESNEDILHGIQQIVEVTDPNEYFKNGWILLAVCKVKSDDGGEYALYSLGSMAHPG